MAHVPGSSPRCGHWRVHHDVDRAAIPGGHDTVAPLATDARSLRVDEGPSRERLPRNRAARWLRRVFRRARVARARAAPAEVRPDGDCRPRGSMDLE